MTAGAPAWTLSRGTEVDDATCSSRALPGCLGAGLPTLASLAPTSPKGSPGRRNLEASSALDHIQRRRAEAGSSPRSRICRPTNVKSSDDRPFVGRQMQDHRHGRSFGQDSTQTFRWATSRSEWQISASVCSSPANSRCQSVVMISLTKVIGVDLQQSCRFRRPGLVRKGYRS